MAIIRRQRRLRVVLRQEDVLGEYGLQECRGRGYQCGPILLNTRTNYFEEEEK